MGDLIYGVHPVREALEANRRRFERIVISKRYHHKGIRKIEALSEALAIPVQTEGDRYFRSALKSMVHQGVAAQVSALPLVDEGSILKRASEDRGLPFILALDGVEDPQNLGSIVRSALALGVHGLVFPKVRSAPLSGTVSKASAGAMEHTLFAKVPNLVSTLNWFKKKGLWVVGTDAGSEMSLDRTDLNLGMVLVIGGEGKGIRPLVRKTCDLMVSVPQHGRLDSLNAAVAAAIVMYEVARQRRNSE